MWFWSGEEAWVAVGDGAWILRALDLPDLIGRFIVVYVHAGDVSGNPHGESLDLFHAAKRRAGSGCYGSGSGGTGDLAECSGVKKPDLGKAGDDVMYFLC